MNLYDSIYLEAVKRTGRADLVDLTSSAVLSGVKYYHTLGYFKRDLAEIQFSSQGVNPCIELNSQPFFKGRLRKIYRIAVTSCLNGRSFPLKEIPVTDMYSPHAVSTKVGYYVVGGMLHIVFPEPGVKIQMLGYIMPVAKKQNIVSWIADLYPEAIADFAAREIFASVNGEAAKFYGGRVAEHIQRIKLDGNENTH